MVWGLWAEADNWLGPQLMLNPPEKPLSLSLSESSVKTPLSREGRGKEAMKSSTTHPHDEEDDNGEVFLDEADIIHELPSDEEGLSLSLSLSSVNIVNMYSCVCFCGRRSS
jgi:hypothetical protein